MQSLSWLKKRDWPPIDKDSPVLKAGDFFSGCGGLSLGLWEAARRCGLKVEFAFGLDSMDEAKPVYTDNFKEAHFFGDDISDHIDGKLNQKKLTKNETIFKKKVGNIDIVVGGPPCQGHSDLNNHSRRDDARNDLYLKMARAVYVLKPTVVLIENVQTVTRAKTNVVQRTTDYLEAHGYSCDTLTLKASSLGLAQRRVRHFTVAVKGDSVNMNHIINSEGIQKEKPVSWAIKDLKEGTELFETPSTHQIQNIERIAWLFGDGWTEEEKNSEFNEGTYEKPEAYNLINHRRPDCHKNGHNYPAVYGRMRWNEAAPTITTGFGSTGQGRFVHPKERRTLTPHEAARVQSFPDFFSFEMVTKRRALHKLIGNAVPPLMVVPLFIKIFNETKLSTIPAKPKL